MKKLRLFYRSWAVMACLLSALSLAAQQEPPQKITGKIFSKNLGTPLAGATITVRGTNNAVVSNEKGEFSIAALPGQILVVSLVGYAPKELKATGLRSIFLEEDYNHLQD
ncbi:MAG TPA: carboxypeptidase-like regulatory domain-containing protein, partial [Puia sp.]|nr:carboxypeptidase-like regulatory domain-containing protein [Puia sp.]